ncbi:hypothetical protein C8Q74DRAFT_1315021 [Fomes fomentarius]|nr:hypothetical protein C8Q74DRAFT_1315021 [Fomes fomentarius]
MPPYNNAPHDRPQSASQNTPADPARGRSSLASTSYTSLGHALAPDASRAPDTSYYPQPPPNSARPPSQMASDSRYMYHPQEVPPAPPYPYPYPAPSYENGQYAQGSSRQPPAQHPQHSQHPPPPAPYNGAPPAYPSQQPGYPPPPAYGVPPPPQQQWQGEWSHYNSPYPPAPPPGQQPYPPPPPPSSARPDLSPTTPSEDRRQEPQPRLRKTRENEPPAPAPAPPAPVPVAHAPPPPPPPPAPAQTAAPPPHPANGLGIDFVKLVESYRLIFESANGLAYEPTTAARPPPPAETVERMLQAATYGLQVLDAAVKRVGPEAVHAAGDRAAEEEDGEGSRGRQTENQPGTEGQTCLGCSATSTPEWRRGPMGPRTLCNACGLVYAKLIKKRNRNEPGRSRGGAIQPPRTTGQIVSGPVEEAGAMSSGDGGSDDDDSYGGSQQDRRSELGYRRD